MSGREVVPPAANRRPSVPRTPMYRLIYPAEAAEADADLRQVVAGRGAQSEAVEAEEASEETPALPTPHAPRRRSLMSQAELPPQSQLTHVRIGGIRMAAYRLGNAGDRGGAEENGNADLPLIDAAVVARNQNPLKRQQHEAFHNRSRVVLETPPLLVTTSVLDKDAWAGPLCGCPLYFGLCCRPQHMPPALAITTSATSSACALQPNWTGPSERVRQQQNLRALLNMSPNSVELEDLLAMAPPQQQAQNTTLARASTDTSRQRRAVTTAHTVPTITATTTTTRAPQNPLSSQFGTTGEYHDDGTLSYRDQHSWGSTISPIDAQGAAEARHRAARKSSSSPRYDYFFRRLFCTRCTIAESTALLFEEERQRQRYPTRTCCECFFGRDGHYCHTIAVMLTFDAFSIGWCPFGCCYMGLGTALYSWRLRYLVRLRYRLMGSSWQDFFASLCCALCVTDQVVSEMAVHGLAEKTELSEVRRIVAMR